MLGFVTSSVYIIGAVLFVALVIYLVTKISFYRCKSCHHRMMDLGKIKIFEGAKSIDGEISFPQIWAHKYRCSSCSSIYLKDFTPNVSRSAVSLYTGEKIKQYIHLDDNEVIKRFKKRLETENFNDKLYNDEQFTACVNNPLSSRDYNEDNVGIAISKEAFSEIYQLAKQYVESNNTSQY